MKIYFNLKGFLIASLIICATQTMAGQDHNSSRSNKTASIVADSLEHSETLLKELEASVDNSEYYSSTLMLARASVIQERIAKARDNLVVGSFINILMEKLKERRCFSSINSKRSELCVSETIKETESILKTKHDTVKNSINNVR